MDKEKRSEWVRDKEAEAETWTERGREAGRTHLKVFKITFQ